jgi:hypothetical protein
MARAVSFPVTAAGPRRSLTGFPFQRLNRHQNACLIVEGILAGHERDVKTNNIPDVSID